MNPFRCLLGVEPIEDRLVPSTLALRPAGPAVPAHVGDPFSGGRDDHAPRGDRPGRGAGDVIIVPHAADIRTPAATPVVETVVSTPRERTAALVAEAPATTVTVAPPTTPEEPPPQEPVTQTPAVEPPVTDRPPEATPIAARRVSGSASLGWVSGDASPPAVGPAPEAPPPTPAAGPPAVVRVLEAFLPEGLPVAGLLPFDVIAVEAGAADVLARLADLGSEAADGWADPEAWAWAAGAALVAGGAYAARGRALGALGPRLTPLREDRRAPAPT